LRKRKAKGEKTRTNSQKISCGGKETALV